MDESIYTAVNSDEFYEWILAAPEDTRSRFPKHVAILDKLAKTNLRLLLELGAPGKSMYLSHLIAKPLLLKSFRLCVALKTEILGANGQSCYVLLRSLVEVYDLSYQLSQMDKDAIYAFMALRGKQPRLILKESGKLIPGMNLGKLYGWLSSFAHPTFGGLREGAKFVVLDSEQRRWMWGMAATWEHVEEEFGQIFRITCVLMLHLLRIMTGLPGVDSPESVHEQLNSLAGEILELP